MHMVKSGVFSKLTSVELHDGLVAKAKQLFASCSEVSVLHGDSAEMLGEALQIGGGGPCVVFLDAHNRFDNLEMAISENPLYGELGILVETFTPGSMSNQSRRSAHRSPPGPGGVYVVIDDFDAFEHLDNEANVERIMKGDSNVRYRNYPTPDDFFSFACAMTEGRARFRKLNYQLHVFWS